MSYAHEIFGVRETRHDMWMQDLLLAGTSSATFNSDRMREIAASPFIKDNGWAGYYLLLWCKYNNVPLKDMMRVGQKVAIRNSDYGTVDNYILVTINGTVAHFASAGFVCHMPTLPTGSTHYDGVADNTLIGAWLKSTVPNWHPNETPAAEGKGIGSVVAEYGYMHGLPEEFKDLLNQNTSQPKYFYPVINDTPYYLYNDWYKLGVRNAFSETGVYIAKKMVVNSLPAKIRVGGTYWSVVLPSGSTQNNAYPLLGPTWLEDPAFIASTTEANAVSYRDLKSNAVVSLPSTSSFPSLARYSSPHLARFTVDV